jgi:predicted RNA-binding Zn ribbon-like protein
MTGERQPGGRRPAPGELELVQAFINSHYDLELEHGADLFAAPDALAAWLRRRELLAADEVVGEADVRRAVVVREALRSVASANGHPEAGSPARALQTLEEAGRGAAVEVRFPGATPRFVPVAGGLDRVLGLVLAITARAMIDGTWGRLKVCPGDHCGWAFYDHSRNDSGRWCSMAVCGGRAKARAHYRRRRSSSA